MAINVLKLHVAQYDSNVVISKKETWNRPNYSKKSFIESVHECEFSLSLLMGVIFSLSKLMGVTFSLSLFMGVKFSLSLLMGLLFHWVCSWVLSFHWVCSWVISFHWVCLWVLRSLTLSNAGIVPDCEPSFSFQFIHHPFASFFQRLLDHFKNDCF